MADEFVVFKPTQHYSEKFNTPVVQKKEYSETFAEFAAKNRKIIVESADNSGGTSTIYTTPVNYTFFLTGCWVNLSSTAASLEYVKISILGKTFIKLNAYQSPSDSLSIQFNPALKIEKNTAIQLITSPNINIASGGISGWLEPNSSA